MPGLPVEVRLKLKIDEFDLAGEVAKPIYDKQQEVIKSPSEKPVVVKKKFFQGKMVFPAHPLDDHQKADQRKQGFGKNLRHGKQGFGKKPGKVSKGFTQTGRPEKDPGKGNQRKGEPHFGRLCRRRQPFSFGHNLEVGAVGLDEQQGNKGQGIDEAPGKKGPVGSVPEAADQEDDEGVAQHLRKGAFAAAKGKIDVVTKPGGERNVPAAPEFGNVTGEIGVGKVLHQVEAKQPGGAQRNVGISGKVAINLKRKENGANQKGASGIAAVVLVNEVYVFGAVVGDHQFFEKSPKDLPQSGYGQWGVKFFAF